MGSFKREGPQGSFGHRFIHFTEDGREVSLESCFGGYCVAIYDKDQNLIGEKKCTNIEDYSAAQIAPGFSVMNGDALEKAIEIANKKVKVDKLS